jgi:hypothetical protein
MFESKFIPFLIFTASLLVSACRQSNDPFWNEVADYFTDLARTKQEIFSRLSPTALKSVVRQPIADTTEPIISLFRRLKDNHNYKVDKKADTVFVSFYPDAEIAGGPFFNIVKRDTAWQIVDIRFGK